MNALHPCSTAWLAGVLAFQLAGCGAAGAPSMSEAAGAADFARESKSAPEAPRLPEAPPSLAPSEAAASGAAATPTSAPRPDRPAALLAYEATISLAVYQVSHAIDDVERSARELEGQILARSDAQVAFRVPRARFEEALARIDRVGDVLHRDVRAEDVGDRYRDLEVRLRNARAVRERLEQILLHATTVKDSLEVEQQLARVTEDIERLAGQIQLLAHRVDFSRITVVFQPRHTEEVSSEVLRLPFPWLRSLGLARLLDLRE